MDTYDYIVTGAGSAGCVIAARLSEDPNARVLLLEAGGADDKRLFSIPAGFAKMTKGIASWGWSTTPQRHMNDRVFWYTQAKVLGGGSTINAQVYTRGKPSIYDRWASEYGCDGWSFADVLPYFRRSEGNQRLADDYHGGDGPLGVADPLAALPVAYGFLRAAQEYGIPFIPDFNGAGQEGCGFYQLTQKDGRRSSTSKAFLDPARDRPNLTVITGAEARRILVENGRAVGVRYATTDERIEARAEAEVIIASGAIGSPRLLLLSGIGPADHLTSVGVAPVHDLPGVGANLHDHIDLFVIAECSGPYSYDHYAKPQYAALAGAQYYLFGRGPAASSLFETGAFWRTDPDEKADVQFHFGQGSGIEAGVMAMKNGVTLNAAYVTPQSRGTVRLASSSPTDAPLIDPNYWSEPDDRRRAIEGLKIARDIMRQPALAPFLKSERLPGPEVDTDDALVAYACEHAKTQHHPVGACRMGPEDDQMAVVDPQLRVRGLDGLRIADSSIMPVISASNTNAASIMIGEKASDLIRGNRRATL